MISVLEYLELSAKRFPDKTAVADPEEKASFEELLQSAERIGSALLRIRHLKIITHRLN